MSSRIAWGIVIGTIALATATLAQEPRFPDATVGRPVVEGTKPRDTKKDEVLPPVATDAQPTPIADQPPILGAPVVNAAATPPFEGRFSMRIDGGDGVSYLRGFSYLEAMIPLRETNGSLFFSDLRIVNFNDENRWEGNAGLAYRWYSEPANRIFGVNLFYDARRTDSNTFQQIGVGFEALSPSIEMRLNGYFIMGAAHRLIGEPAFIDQGIISGNFVTQRFQPLEVARGGLDLEVGGPLPFLDRYAPRAYLGFYTYSAEGTQTFSGIRGRFEAQLTRQISAHLQLQNDNRFDTTVTGGLAVHFGAPAYRGSGSGPASWEDVLRQRIVRNTNVVVTTEQVGTTFTRPVPPPPPDLEEEQEEEEG